MIKHAYNYSNTSVILKLYNVCLLHILSVTNPLHCIEMSCFALSSFSTEKKCSALKKGPFLPWKKKLVH